MTNDASVSARFDAAPWARRTLVWLVLCLFVLLAACGGNNDPAPTAIAAQPASSSVVIGDSATFTVAATGDNLHFRWQQSANSGGTWADIAGATLASYSVAIADASISGTQYRVIVTGDAGSVTSDAVTLTVPALAAPVVTTQPLSASVVAPATASFSVTATGNPAPAYQWARSVDAGTTYADITGATSASYTTPATTVADNGGLYRVRVSNSQGSVTSGAVALSVAAAASAPAISVQPADQALVAPATATFSVTATGTPSPGYQWQLSADNGATFADVSGATSASYTTPATAVADSGRRYRVVVANAAGSVTSRAATLTVSPPTTGGGSVPTTCGPPNVLPAGMVIETTSALLVNGVPGTPVTGTVNIVGASTFQGQPAFEFVLTNATLIPGYIRSFASFDPASRVVTVLGAISHFATADGSFSQDTTSVARQPARNLLYTLAVGQSSTLTAITDNTTVTTTNGVPAAPVMQTLTATTVYTYLGAETLTTPAGTFATCKFTQQQDGGGVDTVWQMVGYGATVKFVSGTAPQTAQTVQTLSAIRINGAALTHFP